MNLITANTFPMTVEQQRQHYQLPSSVCVVRCCLDAVCHFGYIRAGSRASWRRSVTCAANFAAPSIRCSEWKRRQSVDDAELCCVAETRQCGRFQILESLSSV